MKRRFFVPCRVVVVSGLCCAWGLWSAPSAFGQPRLFQKFTGQVNLAYDLRSDYRDPSVLNNDPDDGGEDCFNGEDDDGDGLIDFGKRSGDPVGDDDCWGGDGPESLRLRLPLRVVQSIAGAPVARFTGTDRSGESVAEILINTTGPGGPKRSYLRTEDKYDDVTLKALIIPGFLGDTSGPVALRIQDDGASYFAAVDGGSTGVAIVRQNADGTTTDLAETLTWDNGSEINIAEYNAAEPTCYQVTLTAVGEELTLVVSQMESCIPWFNEPVDGRTATLTISDGSLGNGYVGLRSDGDLGGIVDDSVSASTGDPSVADLWILDPHTVPSPGAPKVLFMYGGGAGEDKFNYLTDPVIDMDGDAAKRAVASIADSIHANYLSSLGFDVTIIPIGSFTAGLISTDDLEEWDAVVIPGSGGSSATRNEVINIRIPLVYAEHVAGKAEFMGLYANNSGNERVIEGVGNCLPSRPTHLHVFSEDEGGSPDHPIVRGLDLDDQGNVEIADAENFDANTAFAFPGEVEALNGGRFATIAEMLLSEDRDEGPQGLGSQTQMGGWPVANGAHQLAGMAHPCTGEPLHQNDGENLLSANSHISLVAAEAGTPRLLDAPDLCPDDPCVFQERVVFYWWNDTSAPYNTAASWDIFRRSLLWSVGLLDSENRSSVPFTRGDANSDGRIDIADAISTLNFLFGGGDGTTPTCLDAADVNDDEAVNISDSVFQLGFLFGGEAPGPGSRNGFQACTLDFTPTAAEEEAGATVLSCESYTGCR